MVQRWAGSWGDGWLGIVVAPLVVGDSPGFADHGVAGGVEGAELVAGEGEEVVVPEVGLGELGEVFAAVGEGVVGAGVARDVGDGVVVGGGLGAFVGAGDAGVVVPERGVVVGVGEFVEDHAGLVGVDPGDEVGGVPDLDGACFVGVVVVVAEPVGAGVVAGAGGVGVVALDPDGDGAEGIVGVLGGLGDGALELALEDEEGGVEGFGVAQRVRGDADGEALDGAGVVAVGGVVDEVGGGVGRGGGEREEEGAGDGEREGAGWSAEGAHDGVRC